MSQPKPVSHFSDAPNVPQDNVGAYLAAIVESSDDAIISKDLSGNITSWNASAERIFGYTAAEAVGKHISLIIPADYISEEFTIISRLRKGERMTHYETIRQTKSGKLLNISLTVSPIRDASGTIIGASKVARDITDRILIEKELREANQRKDEFLAMLAHELRNPLAPISNAAYLLEFPNLSHDKRLQISGMIRRQLDQMTRLLDDLLDVSRITHGKIAMRHAPTALSDVLPVAIEMAKPLLDDKQQKLTVDLPPESLHVRGDATRLSQVFSNVLNNASKYTNRGGTIGVSCRQDGAQAVISITDNGIGIPPDRLENIFDLFTQVDSSMERAQGGLGIGLTLVKKILEMHGGSVQAFSEGIGKGSRFTLRLPLLEASVALPAAGEEVAPAKSALSRRLLVVDDNIASAKTLGWSMELLGHQVRIAHTAEEAQQLVPDFRPDVVLLDIGLPQMNGYELCASLRADPLLHNTIFIAQTGWGREEHKQRSKEAGFHHHLVKPVDMNSVQQILDDVVEKSLVVVE